jgi:hypothetical protein
MLVRHPNHPEYYDFNSAGVRVGFGNVTQADLSANPNAFKEDVDAYLIRSVRWLIDQTKCDGLRLDAVKHVPSYFFGQQTGASKDTDSSGYVGGAQLQFNLTHGFNDANHRDSNFDTETPRTDALIFGEHLGEPPAYSEYIDAGMRLLDSPLRNYLNNVLGNPSATLAGLEGQLADRELELASFLADLVHFEKRYLRTVGRRYAILDELKAKIAEARARRNPDKQDARDEARQARADACRKTVSIQH